MRPCIVLLTLIASLSACNSTDSKPAAPKSTGPESTAPKSGASTPASQAAAPVLAEPIRIKKGAPLPWTGHDPAADLAKLAGRWRVKTDTNVIETWTISGATVKVEREGKAPETAQLSVPMPAWLAVTFSRADGRRDTRYAPFAITPDGIFLGRGTGGVRLGNTIIVPDVFGAIVHDGKTCTRYRRSLSGPTLRMRTAQTVPCTLNATQFTYQMPTKRPGATADEVKLMVKGDAVGDARFFGGRIVKQP